MKFNYIQSFNNKRLLGQNAENMVRIQAELDGHTCEMVGEDPKYYNKGDIIVTDINEIWEVKSDCQLMKYKNILFEHSFKKPKGNEKITWLNKNKLEYDNVQGWLQKAEYTKLIFVDMNYFMMFMIDYPKAKDFILLNQNNSNIVKKVVDRWNKTENKLGTYYLVSYELLQKEGLLRYMPINTMFKFWLKGNYTLDNFRMNWIMKNLHFIPIQ